MLKLHCLYIKCMLSERRFMIKCRYTGDTRRCLWSWSNVGPTINDWLTWDRRHCNAVCDLYRYQSWHCNWCGSIIMNMEKVSPRAWRKYLRKSQSVKKLPDFAFYKLVYMLIYVNWLYCCNVLIEIGGNKDIYIYIFIVLTRNKKQIVAAELKGYIS